MHDQILKTDLNLSGVKKHVIDKFILKLLFIKFIIEILNSYL